jgi:hypothetical protein
MSERWKKVHLSGRRTILGGPLWFNTRKNLVIKPKQRWRGTV